MRITVCPFLVMTFLCYGQMLPLHRDQSEVFSNSGVLGHAIAMSRRSIPGFVKNTAFRLEDDGSWFVYLQGRI